MPKRVSTIPVTDFQGGLNLNANAMQLAENDSPMLLNVDLDPLGGFRRRPAVTQVHEFAESVTRIVTLRQDDYTLWMATVKNALFRYSNDGVTWPEFYTAGNFEVFDATAFPDPVTGINYGYLSRITEPTVRWEIGTATQTVLGTTFVEPFDPITSGNFVQGKFLCKHKEFMFVGSTTTTDTIANRVHFSHPQNAEAWREDDYFPVGDSEPITAMVSFKDSLLIFKENSVWELQGYDADSFNVVNISTNAGASNANAVAVSPDGVYFYSWPYGLYFLGPNGLEYKSGKLEKYLVEGQMQPRYTSESLIWMGHRLYFSVTDWPSTDILWDGIGPTFTFVLDTRLPNDSWTLYSFPISDQTGYYKNGTSGLICGTSFETQYGLGSDVMGYGVIEEEYLKLVRFVRTGNQDLGDMLVLPDVEEPFDPVDTYLPINAYYMTGWQDLNNAAVVKSWGRPIVVMGDLKDAAIEFDVYKNYDSVNIQRDFSLSTDVSDLVTLEWADPAIPPALPAGGAGFWDTAKWAMPIGNKLNIKKGGRIGRATAVAMKIKVGPLQFKSWSVDSIVWKYIPKRVRS